MIHAFVNHPKPLQSTIQRDDIDGGQPRVGRSIGVRHGQKRCPAAALLGVTRTHKIDHDGAQHFADVGEELHPRVALQALALGHAHETLVHQRGCVEPGDATHLSETRPCHPLDFGIQFGIQRTHCVGIAVGCAVEQILTDFWHSFLTVYVFLSFCQFLRKEFLGNREVSLDFCCVATH